MRKTAFAPDEHYHIFNRGNDKRDIFLDDSDRLRFLFLLLFFQADTAPLRINNAVSKFMRYQHRVLENFSKEIAEIIKNRYVTLESFALMPNHFHLMLRETQDSGISKYMQRLLNSYTKYFNTKYEKSGHLFQGPFKAVHVADNRQLLHLSSYIHRNPREIDGWKNREHDFPWSSYTDYCNKNRWGLLLEQAVVLSQFSKKKSYSSFVKSSTAKLLTEELDNDLLFD